MKLSSEPPRLAGRRRAALHLPCATGVSRRSTMTNPSDKGTPTARSVRKAEGLERETARPPKATRRSRRYPLVDGDNTIMRRTLFRTCAFVGVLGLYAACS